jgi:hypothetical protein
VDDALVPVHLVFDSVLRRISVQGTQKNDSIVALGSMVDASTREKLHGLPYMEFVLQHANITL